MSRRFEEDALRWEAGELTLSQLAARHPGRDVARVAQVWEQLGTFGMVQSPDPEPRWEVLRDRLPQRVTDGRRLHKRIRRSLVPALAAALLAGTSVAYAAGVDPVRDVVNGFVDRVSNLFGGDDSDPSNFDQGGGDQGGGGSDQGDQGGGGSDQGDQGNSGSDQGGVDQGGGGSDQGDQGGGGVDQGDQGPS